jgi:exopolyphosphatase / guanosine-5'-triphosphate,3'-diphosphate pyrophosphatase
VPEIVPRWEWRAFGRSFGGAEQRFEALAPERVQESDELYLLSSATDANVKVRDDLLDVKRLEHVDADGLQQWTPVLKADFPVPAAQVAVALEGLGAAVKPARDAYSLDELLGEVVGADPVLRAVRVHKRRQRYTIGGCMSELTDLHSDVGDTRTVAVESEDAAAVIAAVRDLGLGDLPNTSFPRGLKALAGSA